MHEKWQDQCHSLTRDVHSIWNKAKARGSVCKLIRSVSLFSRQWNIIKSASQLSILTEPLDHNSRVESAISRETIANEIGRLIETELERVRMYSERVGEVLSYLEDHPINVQSQKMFYVPTKELDSTRLPDVVEGLTSEDVVLERQKSGGRVNTDPKSKV